jgi:hypothetical protein
MKKTVSVLFAILILSAGSGRAEAVSLPAGFGKAAWGMTKQEIISSYQIVMVPPKSEAAEGIWAVEGPAPGELTVSGEAIGEKDVRSVSFGIHPALGLSLIHIRFKDTNSPSHLQTLIPQWTARYGPPKEKLPGPRVVWEDPTTHIELSYHTVSPRHPTSSDHLAIVLWSIPRMEKIETEGNLQLPDVEKLNPMLAPHKEKSEE